MIKVHCKSISTITSAFMATQHSFSNRQFSMQLCLHSLGPTVTSPFNYYSSSRSPHSQREQSHPLARSLNSQLSPPPSLSHILSSFNLQTNSLSETLIVYYLLTLSPISFTFIQIHATCISSNLIYSMSPSAHFITLSVLKNKLGIVHISG